ncbi:glycoside hydrolase [Granulicella sp. 5B5]|uniref:glycoside hydrolase n=1 Tax=Granulicella sp. 5B5 TaxID=1617967 RepID=UPI0015F671AB|nr:glycoside hydrolase [Granulicella sp. 5B5]QMV17596.1 glycoside hydrolase [Granulicella sp. 5B5]
MESFSRRTFLQSAAAATAAMQVVPRLHAEPADTAVPYPENGTLVPDEGWRLWIDEKAEWQNDEIYLPEEISWVDGKLCGKGQPLPEHEPTGGWGSLKKENGLEVTLPTTVEQHYWGKYGTGADGRPRPYTPEEYRYGATTPPKPPADDNVPQNGAYFGVSWWGQEIEIPAEMRGKRIFLHVRGARLRAEVYLNRKLVGYSIMEELPFECDLTSAADPGGFNLIAIRITNPFGRFDWVDGSNAKWGKLALYRSHGFAGLDRGMTVSAHGDVRIADAWVLNTPDVTKIQAFVSIETTPHNAALPITYQIIDPASGSILTKRTVFQDVQLNSGAPSHFRMPVHPTPLQLEAAELWDVSAPRLYHLRINVPGDTRTIAFGFRWFGPTGIGSDAMFRLNGRRIRVYSAISWGYWGLNGLFPVPELAEKEVVAAKALGLNCLNFHRNLAKEEVLRKQDELGLLRYMEPGAGKLAIGKLPASVKTSAEVSGPDIVMDKPVSEADKFAQRFMFVKCVEMVKAYRSHPSVIEYCLQNEIGADLKNPDTLAVLKAMHDEDPSRCVVLNDGFVAPPRKAAQAWYEPWSDDLKEGKLHRSDEEAWGDWWNQHQGAGDQWYDHFYKSPTEFTYRAPSKDVITEFGEMEGCARPDDHPLMVHQITGTYKKYGGASYDLKDHEEIIAGYEQFIAKWGFRKAFPTAESLFLALGRTEYESWMNYMENARLSDELDFAVISGWESTAIENHSGIVDNLRNFKSDPKLIAGSLLPVRPIAKLRALCVTQGESAVFDLFLANDTPQPATGTLTFSMITPSGKKRELITVPAPEHVVDQFTYLLKEGFETPKLVEEGLYRFKFAISSAPLNTQTKEIWVTGVSVNNSVAGSPWQVAVSGISPGLRKELSQLGPQFDVHEFEKGKPAQLIITSGMTAHTSATQSVGETTGTEANPINAVQTSTELGHIDPAILDAVRAGMPLLCIAQADSLSDGIAKQLSEAGAFAYRGNVGDFRAPWMGNWYFVREHPLFDGMPVNQAMGGFYQTPGRQSNGLLVEGENVEIVVGYSRDHDRRVGAGTFTTKLGNGKVVYHRVPPMHPVMQARFLANAIRWLTA